MRQLLVWLLLSAAGFSQGGIHNDIAFSSTGRPAPGASIRVCSSTATGTPCSPAATVYSDAALTTVKSSVTADSNGNYWFYARPALYKLQVTSAGSTYTQTINVAPTNSNIRYAESYSGADMGAQINAAYADLPASGGTIYFGPKTDGTCYNYSTPIVFATSGKMPLLVGLSGTSNGSVAVNGGCLNFTPSSGSAIKLDYIATGHTQGSLHGFRNVHLVNNGCVTSGGCGGTAIGIETGLITGVGSQGALFEGVSINGFAVGYKNLAMSSSDIQFVNAQIVGNAVGVLIGNSTGILFSGGTIAGNSTAVSANAAGSAAGMQFIGTQFFSNPLVLDFSAVTGNPATVDCIACHFEAAVGQATHFVNGFVNLNIIGGIMEDDNTVGTADYFITHTGNNLVMSGVYIATNRTLTNLVVMNGTSRAHIAGYVNTPSNITNQVGGTNTAKATIELLAGSSANTALPFKYESQLQAPNGTTALPAFSFTGFPSTGWHTTNGDWLFSATNNDIISLGASNGLEFKSASGILWSGTSDPDAVADTALSRLSANVVSVGSALGGKTGELRAALLRSDAPAGGIGYTTGAGCAITQQTNKSTGVSCTGMSGAITLNNASLGATTSVGFTVTDTSVSATDSVIVNIKSGATVDSYTVTVDAVAGGSFRISLRNFTAGSLAEAVVINFVVLKGVAS